MCLFWTLFGGIVRKKEKNRLLKKTKIKKGLSVVLMIPAIIIGIALYEQSTLKI
jgi:hypothetical protein